MKLDNADVREFAALWEKEFGESITLDEARHRATTLLEFYSLLDRSTRHSNPLSSESETHPPLQ